MTNSWLVGADIGGTTIKLAFITLEGEIVTKWEIPDTDGLPMADKTIEEFVFGHHYQPYPLVRYTERPDVAATQLFEGHVVILVDGSPSAMVAPTTFWHHLQHAEEYRQKPIIGAGLRLVRFVERVIEVQELNSLSKWFRKKG